MVIPRQKLYFQVVSLRHNSVIYERERDRKKVRERED